MIIIVSYSLNEDLPYISYTLMCEVNYTFQVPYSVYLKTNAKDHILFPEITTNDLSCKIISFNIPTYVKVILIFFTQLRFKGKDG